MDHGDVQTRKRSISFKLSSIYFGLDVPKFLVYNKAKIQTSAKDGTGISQACTGQSFAHFCVINMIQHVVKCYDMNCKQLKIYDMC